MKLSEKKNFCVEFNGDSITHGGRLLSMDCNHIMGHGYQEMAAAEIGRTYLTSTPRFLNKGVSGQGLRGMAATWDRDVLAFHPDLLTILIGVNDCKCYDRSWWEPEYRALLKKTKDALPEVSLILMEPFYFEVLPKPAAYEDVPHPNCEAPFNIPCANNTPESCRARHASVREMQEIVASLADEFGAILIKSESVLAAAAEKVPVQYLVWDGVHPSMIGHRLLADAWLEAAAPLF